MRKKEMEMDEITLKKASIPRLKRLRNSFKYSFQGLRYAFKYEMSITTYLIIVAIGVGMGIWLGNSLVEWAIIVILVGLILGVELINTSLEAVVDLCCREIHPLAKIAKDTASGATFILSIISLISGAIIYLPKLFAMYPWLMWWS